MASESNNQPLNVQAFLNDHPFSGYQWLIAIIGFLIVIMDGFDTAAIGFIAPSLMSEWHIQKSSLAPVLSAALFGIAFGSLLVGPLSDKFGRKWMLIVAVAIMGAASLLSSTAGDLDSLVFWRFITGFGLGAAMPSAVTLVNEYCPDRKRAFITNTMFCGFPVGSAFGGFFAAWMIPHFGWRSLLVLGGVIPLLLCVLMVFMMPESVRFLVAKHKPVEKIRGILTRISDDARSAPAFVIHELKSEFESEEKKTGLALILSRNFLLGTVMLWLTYFMGLVIVYGLVNWMPVIFKEAKVPPSQAAIIAALFQLGGIGAIFFGALMDRFNPNRVIACGYFATSIAVMMIGQAVGSTAMILGGAVFLAGLCMNAAQSSMQALAAAYYPTSGRATGVAWTLGIGRFGGIAGTFLVGILTQAHLSLPQVFMIVGIPGLIAAAALMVKDIFARDLTKRPIERNTLGH